MLIRTNITNSPGLQARNSIYLDLRPRLPCLSIRTSLIDHTCKHTILLSLCLSASAVVDIYKNIIDSPSVQFEIVLSLGPHPRLPCSYIRTSLIVHMCKHSVSLSLGLRPRLPSSSIQTSLISQRVQLTIVLSLGLHPCNIPISHS